MAPPDERFDVPLYSVTEAAHHIDVPVSTFRTWTHGYERRSHDRRPVIGETIVTTLPRDAGVSVPFVGLAEAHALAAIRRSGVPLQRIRPALQRLRDELGIEHVLASRSLYTDGAEVLYDFAESQGDTPEARSARELVVVRNDQRVFNEIIDSYCAGSTSPPTAGHSASTCPSTAQRTSWSIRGVRSVCPSSAGARCASRPSSQRSRPVPTSTR